MLPGPAVAQPLVDGLLSRLGVTARPPTHDALAELHRRFVETIPYENVDIVLGQPPPIDAGTSAARILAGRGGYCYHLNGSFAALLDNLGYRVTRHVGGVQGREPPHTNGNHMALLVWFDDGPWLVDVGLGDCLHEPVPLREGVVQQAGFELRLSRSSLGAGAWRLEHDPRGTFRAMDFLPENVPLEWFSPMHRRLSATSDSPFVRTFCLGRRHRQGADMLRSLTLSSAGEHVPGGRTRRVLQTREEFLAVFPDVFGVELSAWPGEQLDRLWSVARRQHEEYLARR